MQVEQTNRRSALPLLGRVTCPHCWHDYAPQQTLWIAEHPELAGDPRLGNDQQSRFLPTRFDVSGAALDARGFPCHSLACPRCHLGVPRPLFEMRPLFLSILGAPACGKSYFLASMTWRLRRALPRQFALSFSDADAVSNLRLQEYESMQFLNPNQDALTAIEKTQTHGDLYDTVLYGDQSVTYPRPFLFTVAPLEQHPNFASAAKMSHVLCLYDNAGESFLPGQDTAASPVTRHLAISRALLFLFDPTQDMRFRRACQGKTNDPQMRDRQERLERERPVRQETVLLEAAQRIRGQSGLGQQQKHARPLIVVVTKYDCWSGLLDGGQLPAPWVPIEASGRCAMQLDVVERRSQQVRALLWRHTPEFVSAAESFAEQVIYIPVSATGCSPEVDPHTGALGVRPKDIRPMWVETPLLYAMARWMPGLIPHLKPGPLHHDDRVNAVLRTAMAAADSGDEDERSREGAPA